MELFLCKRFNCRLSKIACVKRQKKAEEGVVYELDRGHKWRHEYMDKPEMAGTATDVWFDARIFFADCAKCKQGKAIKRTCKQ